MLDSLLIWIGYISDEFSNFVNSLFDKCQNWFKKTLIDITDLMVLFSILWFFSWYKVNFKNDHESQVNGLFCIHLAASAIPNIR